MFVLIQVSISGWDLLKLPWVSAIAGEINNTPYLANVAGVRSRGSPQAYDRGLLPWKLRV